MITLDQLYEIAKADIESFAQSRKNAVKSGLETAELAGLLTQKYGQGLAKALCLAAELADDPPPNLLTVVNQCVEAIDPNWLSAQKVRFNARPAGIHITPPALGMVIEP